MNQSRKRNDKDFVLKSIWDEVAVLKVLKESHAIKMWLWLIRYPDAEIGDIPFHQWSVSESSASTIRNDFVKFTTKLITAHESNRKDTIKLLVQLQDGHQIETVVMRHSHRNTVCVSSQVGCQMGCRFCATGTMGIIGNLTAAEIIEQLVHANRMEKIRNVVFMGMGEPLNNYENVKRSVTFMVDNRRFGLSPRHVTVSTVGVTPNMIRLADELPMVNMALSLHAPTQELRVAIVPAASVYKIDKLMGAIDYHIAKTSNSKNYRSSNSSSHSKHPGLMIEYILIKNLNDSEAQAHELGRLLTSRRDHILLNLIPYNPTEAAEDYERPDDGAVELFHHICTAPLFGYHLHTRVRTEMGDDISGACGQLALVNKTGSNIRDTNQKDASSFRTKKRSVSVGVKSGSADIEDVLAVSPSSDHTGVSIGASVITVPIVTSQLQRSLVQGTAEGEEDNEDEIAEGGRRTEHRSKYHGGRDNHKIEAPLGKSIGGINVYVATAATVVLLLGFFSLRSTLSKRM